MIREYLKVGIQISRHNFLGLFLFYFTIYSWYYIFYKILVLIAETGLLENIPIFAVFYFSIALSTLLIAHLISNISSTRIVYAWAMITPISAACMIFFSNLYLVLIMVILSGVLIGIVSWAYSIHFINETSIEERGRLGGVITGFSLFIIPFIQLLANDIPKGLVVCIVLSFFTFVGKFLKVIEKEVIIKTECRYISKANKRSFSLLLISLFFLYLDNTTFINMMVSHLVSQFVQFQLAASLLDWAFVFIGAVTSGILIDWVGRKNVIVITFSLLGIATCFSGLYPTAFSFLILSCLIGFCWGSFLVIFLLVIWGEVFNTENGNLGLSFGVGLSIYHFASGIGSLVMLFPQISLFEATIFNAVIIFSSIITLTYVKETFPAEKASEMQMKLYLERIKKIVGEKT